MEGTVAVLTVCRKGGAETPASCTAGQDNDCNGLAGAADPACRPMLVGKPLQVQAPRKVVRRPAFKRTLRKRLRSAGLAAAPPLRRRRLTTAG